MLPRINCSFYWNSRCLLSYGERCQRINGLKTVVRKYSSTTVPQDQKPYSDHIKGLHNNGVRFGQPTQFSHPHLLAPNELATGILPNEFAERRQRLIEKIREKFKVENRQNLVIIPASPKKYMTEKIPYFYRQNSDFYYLTGCLEPDSILVVWTENDNTMRSILFMRPKNAHHELWDGARTGPENSITLFGVDEAYALNAFDSFIERILSESNKINVFYDESADTQSNLTKSLRNHMSSASALLKSPTGLLHELRVIKSPAEIELMRKTCRIASEAVNKTMQQSRPGDLEHHINARVEYYCRMNNASFLAYPPVVAAGRNANTIHYIEGMQMVNDGEMVLMDAGCEYGGYSSDITRTWPVNGKFSTAQKTLYQVVHAVHSDVMHVVANAESITLNQLYSVMCVRLGDYLQQIGLIPKDVDKYERSNGYAPEFCPHHVSHYLGMDIHDTALIDRNVPLKPGMVFTVEPGIYIPSTNEKVPEEFRGIGIRIEDDVLYKDGGIEVLTESCIKDIDDLETLISSQ